VDTAFDNEELLRYIELAWDEIYELEYEMVFGGWRGVHYQADTDEVYVTWYNSYGGPPLCVKIDRRTGEKRLGYPLEEHIEREEANLARLKQAAGDLERSDGKSEKEAYHHVDAF
jgi:hypothetical protein